MLLSLRLRGHDVADQKLWQLHSVELRRESGVSRVMVIFLSSGKENNGIFTTH